MIDIIIPTEIRQQIIADVSAFSADIQKQDPGIGFDHLLETNKFCPISLILERLIGISERKSHELKYLDIGVGYGISLLRCIKEGFGVVGIEPGKGVGFEGRYEVAKQLLDANGVSDVSNVLYDCSGGEMSCFEDNTFDVVYSFSVLEHVDNIERVLSEARRVLKKGGFMYMNMPNYNSFAELHYNTFWIPFLFKSKKLARLYVRLRGRKDYYIDEMTFVTPRMIRMMARKVFNDGELYIVPSLLKGVIRGRIVRFYLSLSLNRRMRNTSLSYYLISSGPIKSLLTGIAGFVVNLFLYLGFPRTFNLIYFKN